MREVHLQGVSNVRDLGGIPVAGGRAVRRGLIYRGSALNTMTPHDERVLFDELGIACVIDLRCGWEVEAKPYRVPPGVERLHIPFYDRDIVGVDYIEAAAGTKIVGRDIACDPRRFYPSLANPLTAGQMRRAIREIFARAAQGDAVFVHCSGGKDRAGVMTLLVLEVLGADEAAVVDDYELTNVARDRDLDAVFARFLRLADGDEQRARELTESHRARPEYLELFRAAVAERCGSMEAFIERELGIGEGMRDELRRLCTCEAAAGD